MRNSQAQRSGTRNVAGRVIGRIYKGSFIQVGRGPDVRAAASDPSVLSNASCEAGVVVRKTDRIDDAAAHADAVNEQG